MRLRVFEYAQGVEKFTCDEVAQSLGLFRHEVQGAVANFVRDGKFKCLQRRKWKVPAIYAFDSESPAPNFRSQPKPNRVRAAKMSTTEQAWRELRATMNIQPIPDIVQTGQKFRAS